MGWKVRLPSMIIRLLSAKRSFSPFSDRGVRSFAHQFIGSKSRAGPVLKADKLGAGSDYYILFDEKKENGVNSLARVWKPYVKKDRGNFNKMKSWVQILSTPTADTPGTTLLLHFDNKRYLIGDVAEGTQRAAIQRK